MSDITIRLIAPSGYPYDPAAMTRGVTRLREAGCVVDGLDVLQRTELRFSGTDAERVANINALATMEILPDIALVTRGGYGASRLLPHLHYDALRERLADASTLLVGHSDFTTVAASTLQFLNVEVEGDRLVADSIRPDGSIVDTFELRAREGR